MVRGRSTRRGGSNSRRGRGTAATRARGGRVSRGGRGRRGGVNTRRGRHTAGNSKVKTQTSHEEQILDLDIEKDSAKYFTTNATFEQHYDAQMKNCDKYVATIITCDKYSIEITQNAKARSLAAAFARRDSKLMDFLLNHNKQYGFIDVLKALNILDSAREARAKEKKLRRIEVSGSKISPKKLGVIRNDIHNLNKLKPKCGSASGALSRHLRRWVRRFTKEELEFFALFMPPDQWKKLANIVHLHPTKDFPSAPWFLPFCFGADPPKDSMVDKCRNMNEENVNSLIKEFDIPYSCLKKYSASFNVASKLKIANKQDKLDTIIWYYEDLACPEIDDIIKRRLENGEQLNLGYGKLLERLLMFKDRSTRQNEKNPLFNHLVPIAERDLKKFISTIPSPVAVLGDASSSMSVAIRTATIISSLITAICDGKLSFFNDRNFYPKKIPRDVKEVIEVAFDTAATGSTSPAACLVPYYDAKEIVKTFIIVTDEEENTNGITKDGAHWRFYELFMKYRENVYPASLIFISFLHSQHSTGEMYEKFLQNNVPDVLQFKFDGSRPDLTKLDSILGKLCSNTTSTFADDVQKLENQIKVNGIVDTFKNFKVTNTIPQH